MQISDSWHRRPCLLVYVALCVLVGDPAERMKRPHRYHESFKVVRTSSGASISSDIFGIDDDHDNLEERPTYGAPDMKVEGECFQEMSLGSPENRRSGVAAIVSKLKLSRCSLRIWTRHTMLSRLLTSSLQGRRLRALQVCHVAGADLSQQASEAVIFYVSWRSQNRGALFVGATQDLALTLVVFCFRSFLGVLLLLPDGLQHVVQDLLSVRMSLAGARAGTQPMPVGSVPI